MKLRYAQIVFNAFVGLLVLWILRTNMDRDIDSARAAIQRGWLVVGILFAGAYVILRCRKEDREYYQPSSSQEAASIRYRNLGVVAWGFIIVGAVMAIRLVWRVI